MKVLFDHPLPFAMVHGGLQIQIEQTKAALERAGIEVDYLRWWDEKQTGEVIHYFGRPAGNYIDFAHAKGMKVVVAELLTGLGSRPAGARFVQKSLMSAARIILPESFFGRFAWNCYRKADAFVALTEWEASLMRSMFDAAPEKVHVIPNGVESIFFQSRNPNSKGDYLVCTASIHPRKRVLELVQAAVQSKVRVWIIGKPYSETEDYYLSFLNVQKNNQDLILYEGGIADRVRLAKIYREARGFVLLSTMESLSLSALEAAASQCPLLLSDLPWSRECFGREASYLSAETMSHDPTKLRGFYEDCLTLPAPNIRIYTWDEVASQLIACYQSILKPAHK